MIIDVQACLKSRPVSRSPLEVAELVDSIVGELSPLHAQMRQWYTMPGGPREKVVSLEERDAVLKVMETDVEKTRRDLGDFRNLGASLMISNVARSRDWRNPGLVVLDVNPMTGFHRIRMGGLEEFGKGFPGLMLQSLMILVEKLNPVFANVDVKARTPETGLVDYQIDRRLYQHREFFGWMGFVPAQISHAQIRDAHAVHPVDGLGTVIVSVPGVFDPTDDAQVDKVHRVEMDLASYNLLPVTDPHFKG
ncbi:TPA: hypothetical protein ACKQBZ_002222 [Stenotrophomonas maltophilia]